MADAIDWQKIWKVFRRGGFWLALSSVATAIVFGVLNLLTGELVPSIATAIKDYWSPPKYLIIFTAEVEIDVQKATIEALPKGDSRRITIGETTPRYVQLTGSPGDYWITLIRKDSKVLPARLLLKRDDNVQLDTSEDKWSAPGLISKSVADVQSPDSSKQGPVILRTRWTTTPGDYGQIFFSRASVTKTILATALNEVGVSSSDDVGRARIYSYWTELPVLLKNNGITPNNLGPWGGAFLTWVARRSQVDPPNSAAAYNNWVTWAQGIPTTDPEPGAVALFATKAVPGLRGSYLAGVVLRKLPDCTEIVTGNIADRVVITCVALPIEALRRP